MQGSSKAAKGAKTPPANPHQTHYVDAVLDLVKDWHRDNGRDTDPGTFVSELGPRFLEVQSLRDSRSRRRRRLVHRQRRGGDWPPA